MILDLCVPTVFSLDSQEGKESHNYTKLICNSLALTAEDNTTTDKIKGDAKTKYEDLNCTTADACDICSLPEKEEGKGGGKEGGGEKEYMPKKRKVQIRQEGRAPQKRKRPPRSYPFQ